MTTTTKSAQSPESDPRTIEKPEEGAPLRGGSAGTATLPDLESDSRSRDPEAFVKSRRQLSGE